MRRSRSESVVPVALPIAGSAFAAEEGPAAAAVLEAERKETARRGKPRSSWRNDHQPLLPRHPRTVPVITPGNGAPGGRSLNVHIRTLRAVTPASPMTPETPRP